MASGTSLDRPFSVKHVKTAFKFHGGDDQRRDSAFGKPGIPKPLLQHRKSFSCKPQQAQETAFGNKRRYSHSGSLEHKHFKRRRRDQMIPPTKFLLGGNINDPLNLESLADDDIRKNEVTPSSSPLPVGRHQEQIEVLIPQNINDPLNLNSGEDIEFKLLSPKSKRRKKPKKKKAQEADSSEEKESSEKSIVTPPKPAVEKPCDRSGEKKQIERKVVDKIVSPVVPQGMPNKFARRNRSFSHSEDKHTAGKCRKRKPSNANKTPNFRAKDAAFQYGNYDRYYGYRNLHASKDFRLQSLKAEWFEDKDVLDIGCNAGHLTLTVARDFHPKKVIGIDIDEKLVKMARHNVRHYLTQDGEQRFPISMALCHGPIATAALPQQRAASFPTNVFFIPGNYVPESDALLELQRPEFDTILCLSLTKWVHLNWGDDGLKRTFKRMFLQLRPGGRLILEPQLWPSYARKKKLTVIFNINS